MYSKQPRMFLIDLNCSGFLESLRHSRISEPYSNIKPEHIAEYGIGELYDNNNRIDRSNGTMEGTNTGNGIGKT